MSCLITNTVSKGIKRRLEAVKEDKTVLTMLALINVIGGLIANHPYLYL